jgi:hypothetical protein
MEELEEVGSKQEMEIGMPIRNIIHNFVSYLKREIKHRNTVCSWKS